MNHALRVWLLFCAAATLSAQPVDRSKPPSTPDVRATKLPAPFETTLPNGLRVLFVEDARVPLVTMRLVFPCGARRDPKELPGVASAVAGMLLQSTSNRTSSQLMEAVDRSGASMTVVPGADEITIAGAVIAENLGDLLDLASDAARNAIIPELELTMYRQNRRLALARAAAQPGNIAADAFHAAVFGDHPYARLVPPAGSADQLNQKALVEYRDRFFIPNNAILILVGKVPARAAALKLVTDRFASWPRKALPEAPAVAPPAPKGRLLLADRPGVEQAEARVGRLASTPRDPDYFPMMVAAVVAGRRLPAVARMERTTFDEAGVLDVAIQAKNEGMPDALQAVIGVLGRMATEPVTARELAEAKATAIGTFLLQLETQAGMADHLAMVKVLRLPEDYLETYPSRIEVVTSEQVRLAATHYMAPNEDTIVVAGDAAKMQKRLEAIGKFEIIRPK